MERREFLRFAFGIAAGAGAIAAAASAATAAPMLVPHNDMTGRKDPADMAARPAVADQDDLARAEPEKVYWRRRYYRRRYYRRRYYRRRW